MNKILFGVASVCFIIIGLMIIGEPIEKSDTPKTVAKKFEENKKIEVVQEATNQVMVPLSQQALESGCKVPGSQSCSTTTFVVVMGNLTIAILFIGLAIGGILAVVRAVSSIF